MSCISTVVSYRFLLRYQDYYQKTLTDDIDEWACLPEGSTVDYCYWKSPYQAHTGGMNFIMMYPVVNFADGTHLPADRLRKKTRKSKNIEILARKKAEVTQRSTDQFRDEALREKKGDMLISADSTPSNKL
eukprot:GHVT01004139.1.p1 GENE.GHVT01004139.1~~GHVT01004139.1.p1  ORF type:complete len:131 (-),score=7.25 GHVT01004139.1:270-662(-)